MSECLSVCVRACVCVCALGLDKCREITTSGSMLLQLQSTFALLSLTRSDLCSVIQMMFTPHAPSLMRNLEKNDFGMKVVRSV